MYTQFVSESICAERFLAQLSETMRVSIMQVAQAFDGSSRPSHRRQLAYLLLRARERGPFVPALGPSILAFFL